MIKIIVDKISKSFGAVKAVNGLSFNVESGEIAGVVGPDGAGKTTALRIISTVSHADSGSVTIDNLDIVKDKSAVRQKIGYMGQAFGLYPDLSIDENISFFAEIQDVPKGLIDKRRDILLSASGLIKFRERRAGRLSGGMKQKLSLCCALIHEPEILILDEPTNGVDPVSRREFWVLLKRFSEEGTTIIYSTSFLDEAERCDKVNLIFAGEIIAKGTPSELKSENSCTTLEEVFVKLMCSKNGTSVRLLA